MSAVYDLKRGGGPLIVSFPHSGTKLGPFVDTMTAEALALPDTDWHLPRLYDFLLQQDATTLVAHYSRYVVDLNRDPLGTSLYPGQNVTELCPTTTFDEKSVYKPGCAPTESETKTRTEEFWHPYHACLLAEIERIKARHGYALLWDAHSIRSRVPRFFAGRLPDFNLGTSDGATCGPARTKAVMAAARQAAGYTSVLNGRFKGGYITRHYGAFAGVEAIQLELSQKNYMEEAWPYDYSPQQALRVQPCLQAMMAAYVEAGN